MKVFNGIDSRFLGTVLETVGYMLVPQKRLEARFKSSEDTQNSVDSKCVVCGSINVEITEQGLCESCGNIVM